MRSRFRDSQPGGIRRGGGRGREKVEGKANGRGRMGRKERDENGEGGRKVDAYKNPRVAYCLCRHQARFGWVGEGGGGRMTGVRELR